MGTATNGYKTVAQLLQNCCKTVTERLLSGYETVANGYETVAERLRNGRGTGWERSPTVPKRLRNHRFPMDWKRFASGSQVVSQSATVECPKPIYNRRRREGLSRESRGHPRRRVGPRRQSREHPRRTGRRRQCREHAGRRLGPWQDSVSIWLTNHDPHKAVTKQFPVTTWLRNEPRPLKHSNHAFKTVT